MRSDLWLCRPLAYASLSCVFRYGRDDTDVMGISFKREIYMATRQIYPPLQDKEQGILTKVQDKLLRKLGDNAYPFFFEVSIFKWLHYTFSCKIRNETMVLNRITLFMYDGIYMFFKVHQRPWYHHSQFNLYLNRALYNSDCFEAVLWWWTSGK